MFRVCIEFVLLSTALIIQLCIKVNFGIHVYVMQFKFQTAHVFYSEII